MPQKEIPTNWLDRAINFVAPTWGAQRLVSRAVMNSYAGGVATRQDTPWVTATSYRFGSAAERVSQFSMRDRARKAYKDNPIARSVLNTEVDNVIAQGMTLQARTDSDDFNKEAEAKFPAWMEVADIRGLLSGAEMQRLPYRQSRMDGDCGVVLVDRGGDSRLQLVPGDLIASPDGRSGEAKMIDGVEVDESGRPRVFHVLTIDERGKRGFTAVPAANFIYLPHVDQPTQIRGSSCYAQVFGLLDQLDGYVDAAVVAARMGAIFGLIFKGAGAAKQFANLPTLLNSQGDNQRAVTLENGMIKYIGQQDDVVQVNATHPMTQTPDFIAGIMRLIGLPFDMPLEIVFKDVSRANYTNLRAAFNHYYRACKSRQAWVKSRYLDRVYQWWLSREVKLGNFTAKAPERFWDHEFMPRGWPPVDRIVEAQAALLELDMGITTPQDEAAALGRDFDDMQDQQAAAQETRRRLKLAKVHSNYTRHPQLGVGSQGDPLGYDVAVAPLGISGDAVLVDPDASADAQTDKTDAEKDPDGK